MSTPIHWATGWAVVDDLHINVRSISPERRGAMVNWLLTDGNAKPRQSWTDETIEQQFKLAQTLHDRLDVIEVNILPIKGRD